MIWIALFFVIFVQLEFSYGKPSVSSVFVTQDMEDNWIAIYSNDLENRMAVDFFPTSERIQTATINPENKNMNVFVKKSNKPSSKSYSVSSVSSSSSSNKNGNKVSNQFMETKVNSFGDITTYSMQS